MCKMKAPKAPPPPQIAPPRSLPREADGGAMRSNVSRRQSDRLRSGSNTILTSGLGVLESAQTELKTLLGQ